ncbi:MAG TPA: hypothetical protein VI140_08775 [Oxalicibacterium sp.]
MNKSTAIYVPRPGSKVALAIAALQSGPKTTHELGNAMGCASDAVHALLHRPLAQAAIVKSWDENGRLRFALPEMAGERPRTSMTPANRSPTHGDFASLTLISNVRTLETPPAHKPAPIRATSSAVIAGLFSDGELTIAVDGECIRLDTAQRRQLYAYLHKIRHLG